MKWGIGIEHEMRLRFCNKLNILDIEEEPLLKNICKKYNYVPEYLFVSSKMLLNLYNKYVDNIIKIYGNNNNTISNKNNIIKVKIKKIVQEKKEFPFNDIKFYNPKKERETLNNLYTYESEYIKQHMIFLRFNFRFKDENDYKVDSLSANQMLYYVYNLSKVNDVKKNIKKIIDGTYEKQYIKLLKNKLKLYDFNKISVENDIITLSVNKEDTTSSIITFDFFKNKYLKDLLESDINKNVIDRIIEKINDKNFVNNLIKMHSNGIPHIDYSAQTEALEFKTYDHENKNYKKIVDDLMYNENVFFKLINNIPELQLLVGKYGDITYHNTGSLGKTVVLTNLNLDFTEVIKDYAGSFHVWITIPYEKDESPITFVDKHANLANRLQLFEPIFASYFTSPDTEAIGDNLTHSRSSLRHFLNNYSGYGTTNIMYLYGVDQSYIKGYYLNKEDALMENILNVSTAGTIYDSIDDKPIYAYNLLDTRGITSRNFKFLSTFHDVKKHDTVKLNDYMMQVFNKTKIRPLKDDMDYAYIPLGADIRTSQLNKLFYPIVTDRYKEVLIYENDKIVKHYIDIENNKIVKKPEYDMKNYNKFMESGRVGIEFRIFDHMPTCNMMQFMALCAQLVCYSMICHKKLTDKDVYANQQFWHDEMAKSIINGFGYKISKKYLNIINKEFKIKIKNTNKKTKKNKETKDAKDAKDANGMNTVLFFEKFYDAMNAKLEKSKVHNIYDKLKINKKDVNFKNFNRYVWKYNLLLYLKNNKYKCEKIMELLKSNKKNKNNEINNIATIKEEMRELLGKSFNQNIDKIYDVLSNQ